MNLISIVIVSVFTSLLTSFLMMKFHMKKIEMWMDKFFKKEEEYIRSYYKNH